MQYHRQAIILGRGIEEVDGQWQLSDGSMERAQRAIGDYYEHHYGYSAGVLVCSGGYPRLAENRPPKSEALLMADELVKAGIPYYLIETEEESTSTLSNFLNSAKFFNPDQLTPRSPLRVVSHKAHWRRAKFFGQMVLDAPLALVETPGEHDVRKNVQEVVMTGAWRMALAGIRRGDVQALQAREDAINGWAARNRGLLSKIIK